MKLFKDYEEYLETITIMCRDLSDESLKKIVMAINVCDSYMDDREKIYRLNTTIMKCLWEKQEAIEMGFSQYLKKEYKKIREAIDYYKANSEYDDTFIQTMDKIKTRMRNINERKRPTIRSQ